MVTWSLPGPTAQMCLAQITEIVAMLIMSTLGATAKMKSLVVLAMVFGPTRFALCAAVGHYRTGNLDAVVSNTA